MEKMWNWITEFFTKTIEMRLWVVCFIDAALILNIIVTIAKLRRKR